MNFYEIASALPGKSYWETLPADARPVLLYGSGNGADKIIAACESYGIKIDGIFASDGFVRDRFYSGMKVLSYSEAVETYGEDVTVLLCFGTAREDVADFICRLDARHNLIIPEVPLYGGGIFDSAHLRENTERLREVCDLLSDEYSRELFFDTLMFRMTGKLKYLGRCESMRDSLSCLLGGEKIYSAVDGGAFKGDSAADMIASLPTLRRIKACEPDPSTFKKLSAYAETTYGTVEPVNCALGDREYTSAYVSSGSRGSGKSGRNRRAKNVEITVSTVDTLMGGEKLDFLKLDVEGSEEEAIFGSAEALSLHRPAVAVSLYHKTDDITDIPLMLSRILAPCRMYLRRPSCIPMWDLTLYVIPEKKEV